MLPTATMQGMLSEFEKIAEDSKPSYGTVAGGGLLAGAGAGVAASPTTRGRILGYKRVYHGTSADAADKIRREGLLRRYGGTGVSASDVAAGRSDAADLAKGKVYVTPKKGTARHYARGRSLADDLAKKNIDIGNIAKGQADPKDLMEFGKSMLRHSAPWAKAQRKGVLAADLDYDTWKSKFKGDPLVQRLTKDQMGASVDEMPKPVADVMKRQWSEANVKRTAAIGDIDIKPDMLKGSKGGWRRAVQRLKGVPAYAAKHPGRFAKGLGGAAAGLGAIGGGAALIHRGMQGSE